MTRGVQSKGFSSSEPLYAVWRTMLARCNNPKHNRFHVYGGRGISVCSEWDEYPAFRDWATSHGYQKGLQIDRTNSDGGYSPDNCRWVTSRENNRNRRNNRLVTAFGMTKSLAAWSNDPRSQVHYKMLWERLQDGWEFERALTTPQRRGGGYRIITAYGESKSVTEWLKDPRCELDSVSTLWARINRNWPAESAICTPSRGKVVI